MRPSKKRKKRTKNSRTSQSPTSTSKRRKTRERAKRPKGKKEKRLGGHTAGLALPLLKPLNRGAAVRRVRARPPRKRRQKQALPATGVRAGKALALATTL